MRASQQPQQPHGALTSSNHGNQLESRRPGSKQFFGFDSKEVSLASTTANNPQHVVNECLSKEGPPRGIGDAGERVPRILKFSPASIWKSRDLPQRAIRLLLGVHPNLRQDRG